MSSTETHAHLAHHFADAEQQSEAATLGMWVFLATEVLFFGGMFAGYTVYRSGSPTAFAEGSGRLSLLLGTINTGVLLTSSLTMALAVHAAQTGGRKRTVGFLVATLVLGVLFLGIKFKEYGDKFREHLVPGVHFQFFAEEEGGTRLVGRAVIPAEGGLAIDVRDSQRRAVTPAADAVVRRDDHPAKLTELRTGDFLAVTTERRDGRTVATRIEATGRRVELFFSFYFAMTGMHALHMIIGAVMLCVLIALARRGRFSPGYYTPVEIGGLYWHFVDIVWVFLYPLLYLVGAHELP